MVLLSHSYRIHTPKEVKTGMQKDYFSSMFMAITITMLIIITKRWKLTDEWIKKMQSIHATQYYSTLKKKALLTHIITRMNLVNITQSETSYYERTDVV